MFLFAELITYFREKCKICGHHRIMHDNLGKCEGVMNKPCTSGCDKFHMQNNFLIILFTL